MKPHEARAEGFITVENAVRVEIVSIERRWFRPMVRVKWTVLNDEEYKWLSVGETLLSHVNVTIKPEV